MVVLIDKNYDKDVLTLVVIVPSPSLSKSSKASLNSAICSSVRSSAADILKFLFFWKLRKWILKTRNYFDGFWAAKHSVISYHVKWLHQLMLRHLSDKNRFLSFVYFCSVYFFGLNKLWLNVDSLLHFFLPLETSTEQLTALRLIVTPFSRKVFSHFFFCRERGREREKERGRFTNRERERERERFLFGRRAPMNGWKFFSRGLTKLIAKSISLSVFPSFLSFSFACLFVHFLSLFLFFLHFFLSLLFVCLFVPFSISLSFIFFFRFWMFVSFFLSFFQLLSFFFPSFFILFVLAFFFYIILSCLFCVFFPLDLLKLKFSFPFSSLFYFFVTFLFFFSLSFLWSLNRLAEIRSCTVKLCKSLRRICVISDFFLWIQMYFGEMKLSKIVRGWLLSR